MPHIKELAIKIVDIVGGTENIVTVAHCMTRLRLTLAEREKADTNELKRTAGVLGVVESSGQLQIILGPGVVNKVAACVEKVIGDGGDTEEQREPQSTQSTQRITEGFIIRSQRIILLLNPLRSLCTLRLIIFFVPNSSI